MDTKDGLLVPNIKHIQMKSVFQVAQDLNRLHQLGKEGKLGLDDLTGGTFTLSNIGSVSLISVFESIESKSQVLLMCASLISEVKLEPLDDTDEFLPILTYCVG